MKRYFSKSLLATLLGSLMSLSAPASTAVPVDDGTLSEFSLEGLMSVSIDSKTPRSIQDIASTVHVYTSDDIRRHGWRSLSDIFKHIPGVDVSFNGSGVFISARGVPDYTLNGAKTIVMVDGHDMANPSFNSVSYQGFQRHFDVRNAKRIEILVGPGSTLHGANAYGLVVNIISKEINDPTVAQLEVIAGTNNDYAPSFQLGKRIGKWGLLFSGSYWKEDSDNLAEIPMRISSGVTETYDNDLYENNYVNNFTLHGYIDYENRFRLGYIHTQEDNGLGTSFVAKAVGQKRTYQSLAYLDANHFFSSDVEYKLKSHFRYNTIGKDDIYLELEPTSTHTTIQAESYSLVLDNQVVWTAGEQLRLLGGVFTEFTRQSPIAARTGPITEPYSYAPKPDKEDWDNYAVYSQVEWTPVKKLRTTWGVRWISSKKQYDPEILPRVGIVYSLPHRINLKLNYQRGYRPPSVGEIGNTAAFYLRNNDIRSEKIDTIEVGLFNYHDLNQFLFVNFYASRLTDVIVRENITLASNPDITVWDVNSDEIEVFGSEMGGRINLAKKLSVSASVSHTTSTTVGVPGQNKLIIPFKINATLDYKITDDIRLVSDNYLRINPPSNTDNTLYQGKPAPNWYLSNINISYQNAFTVKNLMAGIGVNNIFNDSYGTMERRSSHIRYPDYHPQALRSASISIGYQY